MRAFSTIICHVERRAKLNIGIRAALALFGGYGLAIIAAKALSAGLPLAARADAAALAIMLAFSLHAFAAIWAFSTATVLRAAAGIALPALGFGFWLLLEGTAG